MKKYADFDNMFFLLFGKNYWSYYDKKNMLISIMFFSFLERITGLIMIKYFFDVLLRTNNAFCLAKYDPRGLLSAAFSKCLSSAFFTDVLFTYHFPRLSLRHHIASPLC